ncbi:relaxase/mobilization nuclease domain-containing protein [Ochrobactrum sp. Kaboul]|nr:relaxase/mobilization nuclease domain-containing protein [Ochrobactrum sp. Kaboul]
MKSAQSINRYEYFKTVGGAIHGPGRVKHNLFHYAGNVRSLPQVMFKAVKSGYASGFIGLSAQMNYVLGKATRIIDPSGEVDGQRELDNDRTKAIASRWADSFEKSAKDGRHTIHLVASFPAGTNVGAVEYVIRDACEELLSQGRARFEYIAAVHNDTNNPHGHIIVNRRNAEGEWFYLARDHEFTYDRFKDSLVHHAAKYGVELNNSSRLSRGLADYAKDSRYSAMRGLEGTINDFGEAPFKYREKASKSFFISLDTQFGDRTIWGVGLAGVLSESGAQRGDSIRIKHQGKRSIIIPTDAGQSIKIHRNDWRIAFKGQEFGAFDNEQESKTRFGADMTVARRVEALAAESERYERFVQGLENDFPAMSTAFMASAAALRSGRSVSDFLDFVDRDLNWDVPTANAAIEADSDQYGALFERILADHDRERERMENAAAGIRPALEQRYFQDSDNLQRLVLGLTPDATNEMFAGSPYGDEYRQKIERRVLSSILQRLEANGIDGEEFSARMKVDSLPRGLERHWVKRDYCAIANHHELDLETQIDRKQAGEHTVQLYATILDELKRQDELMAKGQEFLEVLLSRSTLQEISIDESEIIVANMNAILDEDALERIHGADSSVFTEYGFEINRQQGLNVMKIYSEALLVQGFEVTAYRAAIKFEEDVLKSLAEPDQRKGEIRSEEDGESWSI